MISIQMKHQRPKTANTTWLTPKSLIDSLGTFDLDPCCPQTMPWPTAKRMFHYPKNDGLVEPWEGRVWLNPPYGKEIENWLRKMADHRNGIALVPAKTEVRSWFFPFVWATADAVLFIKGRVHFCDESGKRKIKTDHGSGSHP
jgi:hypothetical protein